MAGTVAARARGAARPGWDVSLEGRQRQSLPPDEGARGAAGHGVDGDSVGAAESAVKPARAAVTNASGREERTDWLPPLTAPVGVVGASSTGTKPPHKMSFPNTDRSTGDSACSVLSWPRPGRSRQGAASGASTPTERRAPRRDQLLDAALELLAAKGYATRRSSRSARRLTSPPAASTSSSRGRRAATWRSRRTRVTSATVWWPLLTRLPMTRRERPSGRSGRVRSTPWSTIPASPTPPSGRPLASPRDRAAAPRQPPLGRRLPPVEVWQRFGLTSGRPDDAPRDRRRRHRRDVRPGGRLAPRCRGPIRRHR